MELYIHYTELPENLPMTEIVGQLNETLDDTGAVSGGLNKEKGGRIDLELEDERVNPQYAQIAVKAYLQRAGFAKDTIIEIGGMEIGLYE